MNFTAIHQSKPQTPAWRRVEGMHAYPGLFKRRFECSSDTILNGQLTAANPFVGGYNLNQEASR